MLGTSSCRSAATYGTEIEADFFFASVPPHPPGCYQFFMCTLII